MARKSGILNARKVETLTETGRHADGGNLYLSISENGGKRWVFFYRFGSKRREMGLGSAARGEVSLGDARDKALKARALLNEGIDPLESKRNNERASRAVPTFGAYADEYLASHRSKFRNDKHIAQWEMTLKTYCQPIRSMPLNQIDTEAVLKVLQPIWAKIPETASRAQGQD